MARKPPEQPAANEPDQPDQDTRKPEAVFRIGFVSASVFPNEIEAGNSKRTVRSVHFQKRYRDGDEFKYTTSFGLAELPQLMRVLQLAQNHVEQKEAKLNLDE